MKTDCQKRSIFNRFLGLLLALSLGLSCAPTPPLGCGDSQTRVRAPSEGPALVPRARSARLGNHQATLPACAADGLLTPRPRMAWLHFGTNSTLRSTLENDELKRQLTAGLEQGEYRVQFKSFLLDPLRERLVPSRLVSQIAWNDPESPLRGVQFQYDRLGQLDQVEVVVTNPVSDTADLAISLDDENIFHFQYVQRIPRIWFTRAGRQPWIYSGYTVTEKVIDPVGKISKIDSFEVKISHYLAPDGVIIPALDSIDHDEMVPFQEELIRRFNWDPEQITDINHDFHPDNTRTSKTQRHVSRQQLSIGNWVSFLKDNGLTGEIIWVFPLRWPPSPFISQLDSIDFYVNQPSLVRPRGKHVVASYDFDYFSLQSSYSKFEGYQAEDRILDQIEQLVAAYQANGIHFSAVNFNRSSLSPRKLPDYSPPGQRLFILNGLVSEHQKLLGEVVLKKMPLQPAAAGLEEEERELMEFLSQIKEAMARNTWALPRDVPRLFTDLTHEDPKLSEQAVKALNDVVQSVSEKLRRPPQTGGLVSFLGQMMKFFLGVKSVAQLRLRLVQAAAARYLMSTHQFVEESARAFNDDPNALQGDVWDWQWEFVAVQSQMAKGNSHPRRKAQFAPDVHQYSRAFALLLATSPREQIANLKEVDRAIEFISEEYLSWLGGKEAGQPPPNMERVAGQFRRIMQLIQEKGGVPSHVKAGVLLDHHPAVIDLSIALRRIWAAIARELDDSVSKSMLEQAAQEESAELEKAYSDYLQWNLSMFAAGPSTQLRTGLEQGQPIPLAQFTQHYSALMREPGNRDLRDTVEALQERDVGVWVVPGTWKAPAAEAVSQEIVILVHAADDQRSDWESAVRNIIEEFPLEKVVFKIIPYPADGVLGDPSVPVLAIQQLGLTLPAPSHPIPVISFQTPEQARTLTSAMLYSIAINKAMGSIIAVVRFTDGMGKDQFAVFV